MRDFIDILVGLFTGFALAAVFENKLIAALKADAEVLKEELKKLRAKI